MTRPVIAVSGCIAGESVRFDGGFGKDAFLLNQVAPFADLVTFCPEVEAGMGTPRNTIRLVRASRSEETRVIQNKTGDDWTERLRATSREIAARLAAANLSGVVVRRNSPTCGLERVRIYDWNAVPSKEGVGVFVQALRERFPLLAIEEDGRLRDARIREAFFERVFAHARLRELLDAGTWRARDVVAFHSREKLLLLSHSPKVYREMGRLVARVGSMERAPFAAAYAELFLSAMAEPATPGRQVNTLQHAAGFLKRDSLPAEKARLANIISDYAAGLLPLAVPVAVLRAGIARTQPSWLSAQSWLAPHPKQLRLRTWVP
ncbi:MAG: DUF1722 domain-containing protein [Deltaproteobacteria bacterium]|nr:DUF1722 domain-containing protein [Deltaproteobacteria bacterium]